MYFHSFRNPGLVLDILDDLRRINNMAMKAKQSGIISVGAGIVKHHMCKANCVRNGADYQSISIRQSNTMDPILELNQMRASLVARLNPKPLQ